MEDKIEEGTEENVRELKAKLDKKLLALLKHPFVPQEFKDVFKDIFKEELCQQQK